MRGKKEASDHAPVWIKLSDAAKARTISTPRKSPTRPKAPTRRKAARDPADSIAGDGPLLAIDGDSFANRAYHALPKTISRNNGQAGVAIVGFANFLLRLHQAERPRAVVVGWDTLEVPTERHKQFPLTRAGANLLMPWSTSLPK